MRRHRQDLTLMADWNVTNRLYTAFILLMAFMIVSPAVKHGLELELPKAQGQNIDSTKTLSVVMPKRAGSSGEAPMYIDDRRVSLEELKEEIARQKRMFPELDVLIEADESVPWGNVAQAWAAVMETGVEKIGFPTLPPAEDER